MKRIAIIGSTGSIGTQVLNVVRRYPDKFKVVALTANTDVRLLAAQAREFSAEFVAVADKGKYAELKTAVDFCEVACGADALEQAIWHTMPDLAIIAVVGMCGLKSVMAAIEKGIDVALANKESLVAGGELVMKAAAENNVKILPIDSEHSAVWQCLECGNRSDLSRIILTASGGAFYGKTRDELKNITPEQAVKHPNWSMGKKISVDSATMMNKGLEIIEARWLFSTENIDYVIHPQSIIHSMVEYVDGSVIAQLSPPNMELPIQLAMTYPDRLPTALPRFGFDKDLTFKEPNEELFPLPKIAKRAYESGGNMPCIINAANEAAVQLFLANKIGFLDIARIVEAQSGSAEHIKTPNLEDIYGTHKSVYEKLMRDYKIPLGE